MMTLTDLRYFAHFKSSIMSNQNHEFLAVREKRKLNRIQIGFKNLFHANINVNIMNPLIIKITNSTSDRCIRKSKILKLPSKSHRIFPPLKLPLHKILLLLIPQATPPLNRIQPCTPQFVLHPRGNIDPFQHDFCIFKI